MLATAAFTVLGVGGLLFVGQALHDELPLRAAAPVASLETSHPRGAEPLRENLSEELLSASTLPTPRPLADVLQSETTTPVLPQFDLQHADRKQLEAHLLQVELGEGRHDEKLALLRGLARSERQDKVEWLAFSVAHLPEVPTAKGDALAVVALGLIADLSERDTVARETLERLAFESENLNVVLRRRSAAFVAERCPAHECTTLRRRLLAEPDRSVVAAALGALDRRADERGVAEWLGDFAEWQRPADGEP